MHDGTLLLISMKKINVDRHGRMFSVQMFIAFINFHPLKCLSSRGSPERSMLISQICFAPGVDRVEGKAFSPSEQTRNASLWHEQHGRLNNKPHLFSWGQNSDTENNCGSRYSLEKHRLKRGFEIVTQISKGSDPNSASPHGILLPAPEK